LASRAAACSGNEATATERTAWRAEPRSGSRTPQQQQQQQQQQRQRQRQQQQQQQQQEFGENEADKKGGGLVAPAAPPQAMH
jgi:transcription initiation factor TFIID subunit TAF12